MILGKSCTRNCSFCRVEKAPGDLLPPDQREPCAIAEFIAESGIKYAVITSVTRDDLEDSGSGHFVDVIEEIRRSNPDTRIEVLTPDFKGSIKSIEAVTKARPFVYAHNLETVKRLYSGIRPQADYNRSLGVLNKAKEISPIMLTKSGFMLGMGEDIEEVVEAMRDLRGVGCDILTLGQYLAPSPAHYPVHYFVTPEQFMEYAEIARHLGFKKVYSGPKVRSSYRAAETTAEYYYA